MISRLGVVAINGLASSLISHGLNPDYNESAPLELILRSINHGSILEYNSALTIADTRPKNFSIRKILAFLYQVSHNRWNNSSQGAFYFKHLCDLIGKLVNNALEGS
jgi:hypothetical protein